MGLRSALKGLATKFQSRQDAFKKISDISAYDEPSTPVAPRPRVLSGEFISSIDSKKSRYPSGSAVSPSRKSKLPRFLVRANKHAFRPFSISREPNDETRYNRANTASTTAEEEEEIVGQVMPIYDRTAKPSSDRETSAADEPETSNTESDLPKRSTGKSKDLIHPVTPSKRSQVEVDEEHLQRKRQPSVSVLEALGRASFYSAFDANVIDTTFVSTPTPPAFSSTPHHFERAGNSAADPVTFQFGETNFGCANAATAQSVFIDTDDELVRSHRTLDTFFESDAEAETNAEAESDAEADNVRTGPRKIGRAWFETMLEKEKLARRVEALEAEREAGLEFLQHVRAYGMALSDHLLAQSNDLNAYAHDTLVLRETIAHLRERSRAQQIQLDQTLEASGTSEGILQQAYRLIEGLTEQNTALRSDLEESRAREEAKDATISELRGDFLVQVQEFESVNLLLQQEKESSEESETQWKRAYDRQAQELEEAEEELRKANQEVDSLLDQLVAHENKSETSNGGEVGRLQETIKDLQRQVAYTERQRDAYKAFLKESVSAQASSSGNEVLKDNFNLVIDENVDLRQRLSETQYQNADLRHFLSGLIDQNVERAIDPANADPRDIARFQESERCIQYLQQQVEREVAGKDALHDQLDDLRKALGKQRRENAVLQQEKEHSQPCKPNATVTARVGDEDHGLCQHYIALKAYPCLVQNLKDQHKAEVEKLQHELSEAQESDFNHSGLFMQEQLRADKLEKDNKILKAVNTRDLKLQKELLEQVHRRAYGDDKAIVEGLHRQELNERDKLLETYYREIGELQTTISNL